MAIDNPYNPPGATVADIVVRGTVKHQIKRLSPHQNAKVSAVMMAILSLVILLPMGLFMAMFGREGLGVGIGMMIVAPLMYLVFGYIFTALACALYNFVSGLVGGIEYEAESS